MNVIRRVWNAIRNKPVAMSSQEKQSILSRARAHDRLDELMGHADDNGRIRLRRWEAAKTHRLNQAHWACVNSWHGHSINDDLEQYLETLVARCSYEMANNPIVEGVVETYCGDVVGKHGPDLKVVSDNEAYNKAVQDAWKEYWKMPDVRGQIDGVAMYRMLLRNCFTHGSGLYQWVSTNREGPFSFAVRILNPARLRTPYEHANDPMVSMGIRQNGEDGAPTAYYIRKPRYFGGAWNYDIIDDYDERSAEVMQHIFLRNEPDQITGYPWLAVSLDTIAQLRDYDAEEMEAARQQNHLAVFWSTENEDVDSDSYLSTATITRGQQEMGPPGAKPNFLQANHPHNNYREFRHEKLRDLGRPHEMPLMTVLMSAQDMNFSSAHYDSQVYTRHIVRRQDWGTRELLEPQLEQVELETLLAQNLQRPAEVTYEWTYDRLPFVKPKEQYETHRMQYEDGVLTFDGLCAIYGEDGARQMQAMFEEDKMRKEFGLPERPKNVGNFQPMKEGSSESNSNGEAKENETESQPA